MAKIYIDNDFKCHIANKDGIYRELEEPYFNGKCSAFIEGYRLKPDNETWVREDGVVFSGGKMITPWKNGDELDAVQREYEQQLLQEYKNKEEELNEAYTAGVSSI